MKVLILGASGMLGHKLILKLSNTFDVAGTVRSPNFSLSVLAEENSVPIYEGVDALITETVEDVIRTFRPDAVLNCIGIVKQLEEAKDPYLSISINALFPHTLGKLAAKNNFRLIHFSTDCVFSGKKGHYTEEDKSDVSDLYGMTKYLGEVQGERCLTLRTSIIGQEINKPTGLIEWFLSQKGGAVNGFTKALYTGLTTNAVADLLAEILLKHQNLSGMYQVSADEISKYDLLQIVNEDQNCGVTIKAHDAFVMDRSLNSQALRNLTGWRPLPWPEMIKTMFTEDDTYYKTLENQTKSISI